VAHRYGDFVRVEIEQTKPGEGILHAFTWRGVRSPVAEVLSRWHLRDRWWDRERHSDRHYWRVQTPDYGVFELYHDSVSGVWILDVVQD
jgi:Family of unknown function (DUF6504)